MSEVTVDASHRTLRIVIRAFADDYQRAVMAARHLTVVPKLDGPDAFAYLQSALAIDDNGSPMPLRACGIRTSADVIWLCLETTAPSDLSRVRVRDALLWDLFDDQVNIVRATIGGGTRSLLFVKGDHAKPLD